VLDELLRVDQMSAFLFRAQEWQMPALPDVRTALRRLGVAGSVLDGRSCAISPSSCGLGGNAPCHPAARGDYPLLAGVAERMAKLDDAERRIRAAVDDGGSVRDSASRDLARLRREIRGARSRIVEGWSSIIARCRPDFQVADASVTVRDGRYVIPIRREGRGEVGGLVHDESATGHTLFVEPPVAIELMNRLRELELAEAREVQRILRELTESMRPLATSSRLVRRAGRADSLYRPGPVRAARERVPS
jgi:DNA mismatch repair protein MutS2